jgi:hypothetical protein
MPESIVFFVLENSILCNPSFFLISEVFDHFLQFHFRNALKKLPFYYIISPRKFFSSGKKKKQKFRRKFNHEIRKSNAGFLSHSIKKFQAYFSFSEKKGDGRGVRKIPIFCVWLFSRKGLII